MAEAISGSANRLGCGRSTSSGDALRGVPRLGHSRRRSWSHQVQHWADGDVPVSSGGSVALADRRAWSVEVG
jgi:hypothetical protein